MVTAFLTDTTLCIGCKACEVACKEWNQVPSDGYTFTGFSYDNTAGLGHSTWRHVKFVERMFDGASGSEPRGLSRAWSRDRSCAAASAAPRAGSDRTGASAPGVS